jgi:hypothetical protein
MYFKKTILTHVANSENAHLEKEQQFNSNDDKTHQFEVLVEVFLRKVGLGTAGLHAFECLRCAQCRQPGDIRSERTCTPSAVFTVPSSDTNSGSFCTFAAYRVIKTCHIEQNKILYHCLANVGYNHSSSRSFTQISIVVNNFSFNN